MNAEFMIRKARAGLILDLPFFGSLALRLTVKEDPGCQTAWTDGRLLGYNPQWVESMSLDEVKAVLCHEVMHCAMQHQTRRQERSPNQWNVAADYAINPIVQDAGLKLPAGALVESQYHGQSAEQIYAHLPKGGNQGDEGEQQGGSGEGQQQGGSGGQGQQQQPKQQKPENKKPEPKPEEKQPEKKQPQQNTDPGGTGEVRDATNEEGQVATEADKREMEQDWKVAVVQAATQQKNCGSLPGELQRMVEDIVDPVVDWRELLRRFVDQSAKNDYRWFPPNRRHIHDGMYLPSARSEELGTVVVAIDTSGSIAQKELDQFTGELNAILEDYKAGCKVIYCDSRIAGIEEFQPDELPVVLDPKGGGGTNFKPPFDYLEEEGEIPPCFIYFTDGMCSQFPEEPEYPVLWACTEKRFDPPFGEVVEVIATD